MLWTVTGRASSFFPIPSRFHVSSLIKLSVAPLSMRADSSALDCEVQKETFIFRVESFLMYMVFCNPIALSQAVGFELPKNLLGRTSPHRGFCDLQ
jgi:hypothetical protein